MNALNAVQAFVSGLWAELTRPIPLEGWYGFWITLLLGLVITGLFWFWCWYRVTWNRRQGLDAWGKPLRRSHGGRRP